MLLNPLPHDYLQQFADKSDKENEVPMVKPIQTLFKVLSI